MIAEFGYRMAATEFPPCRTDVDVALRSLLTSRRKWRRRIGVYSLGKGPNYWMAAVLLIVFGLAALPVFCAVLWLRREHGLGSAFATAAGLWSVSLVPFTLVVALCLLALWRFNDPVLRAKQSFNGGNVRHIVSTVVLVFGALFCGAMLWRGNIYAAFLGSAGVSLLLSWQKALGAGLSARTIGFAVVSTTLFLAFLADREWLFYMAQFVAYPAAFFIPWPLHLALQNKLPRTTFLRAQREKALAMREQGRLEPQRDFPSFTVRALIEAELWDEALVEARRARVKRKERARSYEWRAEILYKMGAFSSVLRLAKHDSAETSGAPDFTRWIIRAHAALGEHDVALAMARRAVEDKRDHAELVLAETLLATGQRVEAAQIYDRLFTDPGYRKFAARALAQIFGGGGYYREAALLWRQTAVAEEFLKFDILGELAFCCACANDRSQAKSALQLATRYAETPHEKECAAQWKYEIESHF